MSNGMYLTELFYTKVQPKELIPWDLPQATRLTKFRSGVTPRLNTDQFLREQVKTRAGLAETLRDPTTVPHEPPT
jgi:hypothetical protein